MFVPHIKYLEFKRLSKILSGKFKVGQNSGILFDACSSLFKWRLKDLMDKFTGVTNGTKLLVHCLCILALPIRAFGHWYTVNAQYKAARLVHHLSSVLFLIKQKKMQSKGKNNY